MHVLEAHDDADTSTLFLHGGNVAGWMWTEQVSGLPEHHCLVPDLPGFGASADLDWTSLADVADRLAELVRRRARGGRAHIVGLSLGAVIGTVLTARHPDVVRSAMLTGATLTGVTGATRTFGLLQLKVWEKRWYWAAQARTFQMPADTVDVFIETGMGIRRATAEAMMRELYDGVAASELDGLRGVRMPILALAGEREPRLAHNDLAELVSRSELVTARVVPGMHHAWNAENPELFNAVMREWLLDGRVHPELLAP
ncbi:pimeloyl-ACP methyl ester carboxylesterase [Homoserinimonas aerilata]|uniref:Pimeloyl-ACP methyl ester carboxylesterase n=1 Tax=Homoserinimonas aerilata TaxID=1162970 RepID=A0A542YGF9_9MICO|nr:alpha/beta hydrolase [Homoserinimonas aerilata]TQL47146.1 pimeloyl-ACP methyl ester carboxylesterase [Homoserinimonas aerilata]